jgi:diguanylate cyclase (GGDEF)-like protein
MDAMPSNTGSPLQQAAERRFLLLVFPRLLEERYQFHQQQHAARDFRYRSIVVLILYTLLSTGIAELLPSSLLWPWLTVYGWVGVIIVLVGVLSHIRALDQWFSVYVGLGSMLSVALSVAAANMINSGQSSILPQAGIMYAVVIIYAFVGLRFYHAMAAGWIGGIVGLLLTMYLDGRLDWPVLHRTYSGTSLLGMCLAYAIDYRNRVNFLQACALEDAHRRSESQNRQLQALSREDALTGLANRRYLDLMLVEEWNRAMRQQLPLAVLMIDVDHFKAYNDHLGHPAGDVCLREVARVIKSMTRRSGDFAARYGGEEFALIYPSTNASQALGLARQLIEQVSQLKLAHPASSVGPVVTVSVGVAVTIPNGEPQQALALVDQADHALYLAKQKGRNMCVLHGHHLHVVPDPDSHSGNTTTIR